MARKKSTEEIVIKDVTNERPVVELNTTKADIAEIKSLMSSMLTNLERIEAALTIVKNKSTGGF